MAQREGRSGRRAFGPRSSRGGHEPDRELGRFGRNDGADAAPGEGEDDSIRARARAALRLGAALAAPRSPSCPSRSMSRSRPTGSPPPPRPSVRGTRASVTGARRQLCSWRAIERAFPREDARVGRIAFDFFGPVPVAEVTVTTEMVRPGQRIEVSRERGGSPRTARPRWSGPRGASRPSRRAPPPSSILAARPRCRLPRSSSIFDAIPYFGYGRALEWALRGGIVPRVRSRGGLHAAPPAARPGRRGVPSAG